MNIINEPVNKKPLKINDKLGKTLRVELYISVLISEDRNGVKDSTDATQANTLPVKMKVSVNVFYSYILYFILFISN